MSYYYTKTRIALALNIKASNIFEMNTMPNFEYCQVSFVDNEGIEKATIVTIKDMIATRKHYIKDLEITSLSDNCFEVTNKTKKSSYCVQKHNNSKSFSCNCKDYEIQSNTDVIVTPICKHIYKVFKEFQIVDKKTYLAQFNQEKSKVQPKETMKETMKETTTIQIDDVTISYPSDKPVDITVNGVHIVNKPKQPKESKKIEKSEVKKESEVKSSIFAKPAEPDPNFDYKKELKKLVSNKKIIKTIDDQIEADYQDYLDRSFCLGYNDHEFLR